MSKIVKITGVSKIDGSSKAWYLSFRSLASVEQLDSEADGPGNRTIPAIKSIGAIGSSLSDSLLTDVTGIRGSVSESFDLSLENPTVVGPSGSLVGQFDEMRSYTLQEWSMWSGGTKIISGIVQSQPRYSDVLASESRTTSIRLANRFSPTTKLRKWAGTLDALEWITTGASATVPSSTAFDNSAFALLVFFGVVPSNAHSTLIERVDASTGRHQFKISLSSSVNFSVQSSTSTDSFSVDLSDLKDGPFHWCALSYNPAGFFVTIVDGFKHLERDSSLTPLVASGEPIIVGRRDNTTGIQGMFGHTMLSRSMSAREMQSFSFSSIVDDPSLELLLLGGGSGFQLDDTSGKNRHATIGGTENTHWQRAPSYAGSPEIEGEPIAEWYGLSRSVEPTLIDSGRSIYHAGIGMLTGDEIIREGGDGNISPLPSKDLSRDTITFSGTPTKPVTIDKTTSVTTPIGARLRDIVIAHTDQTTLRGFDRGVGSDQLELRGPGGIVLRESDREVYDVVSRVAKGLGAAIGVAADGTLEIMRLQVPVVPHPHFSHVFIPSSGIIETPPATEIQDATFWMYAQDSARMEFVHSSIDNQRFLFVPSYPGADTFTIAHVNPLTGSFDPFVGAAIETGEWYFVYLTVTETAFTSVGYHIYDEEGSLISAALTPTGSAGPNTPKWDKSSNGIRWIDNTRSGHIVRDLGLYDPSFGTQDLDDLRFVNKRPHEVPSVLYHAFLESATWNGSEWLSPVNVGSGDISLTSDPNPIVQPEATIDLRHKPNSKIERWSITPASNIRVKYNPAETSLKLSDLGISQTSPDALLLQKDWQSVDIDNDLPQGALTRVIDSETFLARTEGARTIGRVGADILSDRVEAISLSNIRSDDVDFLSNHAQLLVITHLGKRLAVRFLSKSFNASDTKSGGSLVGYGVEI